MEASPTRLMLSLAVLILSLTLQVMAQGGTDTATVTITVASVNDPPVATDDAYSTDRGHTPHRGCTGCVGK